MLLITAALLTVLSADATPVTGDQSSQLHLLSASPFEEQQALKAKVAALEAQIQSIDVSWPRGAIILLGVGLGVGVLGFGIAMILGVVTGIFGGTVLAWMLPLCTLPGILMMIASVFWGVPVANAARQRVADLTREKAETQARLNSLGAPHGPPFIDPQVRNEARPVMLTLLRF